VLAVLTDSAINISSSQCPSLISDNFTSIKLKGGFLLAENEQGISIFSIDSCAEVTGTNNKPGKPAFYPPYFAFADGKSFRVYRIDSTEEVISGQLKENIQEVFLDDGYAAFILDEKLVTLDFAQRRFTGLSPLPVDFTSPHIEEGRLIGYGRDRFYSINYQDVNKGGVPEILDFPSDNMTDCVTVSGSADAYCGGKFVKAGIYAGLPSEKTAIADGFTLHFDDGALTALSTEISYTKDIFLNYGGTEFCTAGKKACYVDFNEKKYCVEGDVTLEMKDFPDACEPAELKHGRITDEEGNVLLNFADVVNSSDTHEMLKRMEDNAVYYFFMPAEKVEQTDTEKED